MKGFSKQKILVSVMLIVLAIPISANPFFNSSATQGVATDESSNEQNIDGENRADSSEAVKQPLPVRISGGNTDLIKTQGTLREQLGEVFYNWDKARKNGTNTPTLMWAVLWLSFLYGIIHAIGPGHRKTIVFSLYLTRKASWWEPAFTGILLSLLHGGTAVAIILIFKGISGSIVANTATLAIYMEGFSYVLLIITALILMIHEIIGFSRGQHKCLLHPKEKIEKKTSLVSFLLASIYPCPGALLVLVLAFTLNILSLGIISIFAMSFGMAVPIIGTAYFAWAGRTGLFKLLKQNERLAGIITFSIEMIGYSLLLIFSLYISWPFLISLFW